MSDATVVNKDAAINKAMAVPTLSMIEFAGHTKIFFGSFDSYERLINNKITGIKDAMVVVGTNADELQVYLWGVDTKHWVASGKLNFGELRAAVRVPHPLVGVVVYSKNAADALLGRITIIGVCNEAEQLDKYNYFVNQYSCVIVDQAVYTYTTDKGWVNRGILGGDRWTAVAPSVSPGIQHQTTYMSPAPVHETPLTKWVHDTSAEQQRALQEQRISSKEHPSLEDVEVLLEHALDTVGRSENDVAVKALEALKKVKKDNRRKRVNLWVRRVLGLVVLGLMVWGLYKWIPTQVTAGYYTVPKSCAAPFGNGELTGTRFYDYKYKALFGIHFTLESTVVERTTVNMIGQEFSIFGLSPRGDAGEVEELPVADKVLKAAEVEVVTAPKPPKGKWWRMNVWASDKGTQPMKPAELYLFASEKNTTMVAYKDFCK